MQKVDGKGKVIGIDVGGTFTNAVAIVDGEVVAEAKAETTAGNLLDCILPALDEVVAQGGAGKELSWDRIVLSTTLSTNAIVTGRFPATGVIAMPGPGVCVEELGYGSLLVSVPGYVDHRGREVAHLDEKAIRRAATDLAGAGARALAVVGKFSVRNPDPEKQAARIAVEAVPEFAPATHGHELSGLLNFPRRVATARLNAGVAAGQRRFVAEARAALEERGLQAPLFILKADGGTMPLAESVEMPVQTILSGPAASLLGAVALIDGMSADWTGKTWVFIDVGGTTTDIAVAAGKDPLFEPRGAMIGGHRTLVRAFYTHSAAIGGDSRVSVRGDGAFVIGPERLGPAAGWGGPEPTPTDACLVLGLMDGDAVAKRRAAESLGPLAERAGMDVPEVAARIVNSWAEAVAGAIRATLARLENRPVYTVSELLAPRSWRADVLIGIGGPAEVITPRAARLLGCRPIVPEHFHAANAIGAALARPTATATVHVDTAESFYAVAEAGVRERIARPLLFTVEKAENLAQEWARRIAEPLDGPHGQDWPVEITEATSFNVVRGFHATGKIMDVRAQVKPGLWGGLARD